MRHRVFFTLMSTLISPVQNTIDAVDFAITCLRTVRHLKESEQQGQIDSIAYRHITHDLENIIEEVTVGLLRSPF